jgi:hypothetical protein
MSQLGLSVSTQHTAVKNHEEIERVVVTVTAVSRFVKSGLLTGRASCRR